MSVAIYVSLAAQFAHFVVLDYVTVVVVVPAPNLYLAENGLVLVEFIKLVTDLSVIGDPPAAVIAVVVVVVVGAIVTLLGLTSVAVEYLSSCSRNIFISNVLAVFSDYRLWA